MTDADSAGADTSARLRQKLAPGEAIQRDCARFPAVVVMPQCPKDNWWSAPSMEELALAAMDAVRAGPLPALVVCHGGTIRVILAAARPEGLDAFHDPERIPNATVIRLDDDGRWTNAA